MIRILFRCWKDRKPYCEEIYRQALHRRKQMTTSSPVQLQWKTCAGFSKIAGRLFERRSIGIRRVSSPAYARLCK